MKLIKSTSAAVLTSMFLLTPAFAVDLKPGGSTGNPASTVGAPGFADCDNCQLQTLAGAGRSNYVGFQSTHGAFTGTGSKPVEVENTGGPANR